MLFGKKKQKKLLVAMERGSMEKRYWGIIWQRFRKNKMALWALRSCGLLIAIALLGPFIANDKPLYAKIDGQHHFPAFKDLAVKAGWSKWQKDQVFAEWGTMDYESVIRTPIPYHANYIDKKNTGKGPFDKQEVRSLRFRHWLGTDQLGRDVTAGMIRGTGISFMVGFFTMFIATVIGLFLGTLAGYFGDGGYRMSRIRVILNFIGLLIGLYYAFGVRGYLLTEADHLLWEWIKRLLFLFSSIFLFNFVASPLEKIPWMNKRINLGFDLIIMRLIEALNTIPGIFLLLAALPLFPKASVFNIILILGLIAWTGIARYIRAELLRVRNLQYIEAAKALGYRSHRIILKHALPNALTPVLIVISFGVAGVILAETSLSFLGIGVDPDDVTWGKLLSNGRNHFSYWWLTVFPGIAIFFTVTIFNLIGDGLSEASQ